MSRNIALVGNPNTGKSSIFNLLTGLNQKVGNYPGVTVDKKQGQCSLPNGSLVNIIDLPGIYSLSTANSMDELVVLNALTSQKSKDLIDLVVVVTEAEQLKRNLLLFTQIVNTGIPSVLVINMSDTMARKGIEIDVKKLEALLDTKIILVSARKNQGLDDIKIAIRDYNKVSKVHIDLKSIDHNHFNTSENAISQSALYISWLKKLSENRGLSTQEVKKLQHRDSIVRYLFINKVIKDCYVVSPLKRKSIGGLLDRILMHKVYGYIIFILITGFIFQAIYSWSAYPMNLIDNSFVLLSDWVKTVLPSGEFTNLIAEGLLAGIGGIVIFIPQIALLFMFIALLEESGYMSRVVYLMDKIMSNFGLSGKSVIPLISGIACAIPAIMAARSIDNAKERLLTILITPFMTCSARLPVYLIIISVSIPHKQFLGFNLQGLVLLGLYVLGVVTSITASYILNKLIKSRTKSIFVVEIPSYKMPLLKNIFFTIIQKSKSFVLGAGKIILAVSTILWFLASHGTYEEDDLTSKIIQNPKYATASPETIDFEMANYKLEHSYIGHIGKFIEPVVKPLGYDWKIAIALITSFVAREVFVGTIATIYSTADNSNTIKDKMIKDINTSTGKPLFNLASGVSLLFFYAFAMQCMSTLAIVRRETNSWKWPLAQLVFMSIIAYITALIAYQTLNHLV